MVTIKFIDDKKGTKKMKFTLIEARPKMNRKSYAVTGKVQVADWLERVWNDNEISDEIDSFFDGFGDLVRGEDGKLYLAEICYAGGESGYGIWCELKDQSALN